MPELSVVMSVYNETIDEITSSIDSILNQSFFDFEFIIILDDPRNEHFKKLLTKYQNDDNRIKLIINSENMGLAASLNVGIKEALGKYIARMDADDIAMKDRFRIELNHLKTRGIDLIASSSIQINENNEIIGEHPTMVQNTSNISELLRIENFIVHPSVIGKKSIFKKANYYNELLPACEDYDLWLRMMSLGVKIGITNEKLIKYRIRTNSMTQSDRLKTFLISNFLRRTTGNRLNWSNQEVRKNLDIYLEEHGYFNESLKTNFNKALNNDKKSIGKKMMIPVKLLFDTNLRNYYLNFFEYKKMRKKMLRQENLLKKD